MTLPVFAPAVAVDRLAVIADALLPPAIRCVMLPADEAAPVDATNAALRSSLNAPVAAVLRTVNAWPSVPPTRVLPSDALGDGVAAPTAALYAAAPLPSAMFSVCSERLSKLFAMWTAWPDIGASRPACVAVKVTPRLPLFAPAATGP